MKLKQIRDQQTILAERLSELIIEYIKLDKRMKRCKKGGETYKRHEYRHQQLKAEFLGLKLALAPLSKELAERHERWKAKKKYLTVKKQTT